MAPRSGVHPRTRARKRALTILFDADLLGRAPADVLDEAAGTDDFCRALVAGVAAHAPEIDALIRRVADRWTLERMPVVDRNLLRIGLYELLYSRDAPDGAVINEVVELAKLLSTEDSGRFVNAILGRAVRERDAGAGGS